MKIFVYCFREFDEKEFFDELVGKYGYTYGYTAEHPNLKNAKLAEGYDAVSVTVCDFNAKLLDCFRELGVKYVATRSIGYDHIDIQHAKKVGMKVSHVSYEPDSVAEYTVMLMMMGCRRICHILDRARIQDFSLKGKLGKDLGDCTVGVIGTGRIGMAVIKYLKAFGCRVLVNTSHQKEELSGLVEYTEFDTLLKESDIITLHASASKENYHLIDKKAFDIMKNGVMIVNTARGTLIDTDALIDALEKGKVSHAALDVIENEYGLYYINRMGNCIINRQMAVLKSFPNVILSPHTAFYTRKVVSNMVEKAIQCICDMEKNVENPLIIT